MSVERVLLAIWPWMQWLFVISIVGIWWQNTASPRDLITLYAVYQLGGSLTRGLALRELRDTTSKLVAQKESSHE